MKDWKPSDLKNAKPIGTGLSTLEFQDDKGKYHDFHVLETPTKIVFGGVCNAGFIESGYIVRDGFMDDETGEYRLTESLDETLQELFADLQTYYNDGRQYVSRIVCNERM